MDTTPLSILLEQKGNKVVSVTPETSIQACVETMRNAHIGAVVVLDEEQLVGIFTERDVLNKVAGRGYDLNHTAVSDVMTANVKSVPPEMTVSQAMALITNLRFRHLPVTVQGKLVGLLSSGDLTRWMVSGQEHEIEELMKYINQTQHPNY